MRSSIMMAFGVGILAVLVLGGPSALATVGSAVVNVLTDSDGWQSGSTSIDTASAQYSFIHQPIHGDTIQLTTALETFAATVSPTPPCSVSVPDRSLSCQVREARMMFNAPSLTVVPNPITHRATYHAVWVAGYGELFYGNTAVNFDFVVKETANGVQHFASSGSGLPLVDSQGTSEGQVYGTTSPETGITVPCPASMTAIGTITVTPENYSPHNSVSLDTLPGSC